MAEEVTGPRVEFAIVILLNVHAVNCFLYLYVYIHKPEPVPTLVREFVFVVGSRQQRIT